MGTLSEAIEAGWREQESKLPASDLYDAEPCVQCHRYRVILLVSGERQCEKCDTAQPK